MLILTWNDYKGYSNLISNWRNVQCDWATNPQVAQYYSGKKIKSYRTKNAKTFFKDVIERDQRVGIDYYALYGVTKGMIPGEIVRSKYNHLLTGKVFVYRVSYKEGNIYFQEVMPMN